MRTRPKPCDENGVQLSPKAVFRCCISRVRAIDLKTRLEGIEDHVVNAAKVYDLRAASGDLHLIRPDSAINESVSNEEMVGVYTKRMVPKRMPGRAFYNRIIGKLPAICPLCDIGSVWSLDHQLPKSKFSAYTVTPNNLVPSCQWCQNAKDDFYPVAAGQQTLHPYFDNFENELWLAAEVIAPPDPVFVFTVKPPDGWSATRALRAQKHLEVYNLNILYHSNAVHEISSRKAGLTDLLEKGGPADVRKYLLEEFDVLKRSRTNSWRIATYAAAAASDWFCAGGFNEFTS